MPWQVQCQHLYPCLPPKTVTSHRTLSPRYGPYFYLQDGAQLHEMLRLQLVSLLGLSQKRIQSTVRSVNCLLLWENIWDTPHKRNAYVGSRFQGLQVQSLGSATFSLWQQDTLWYELLMEGTSDSMTAKTRLSRNQEQKSLVRIYTSIQLPFTSSQPLKVLPLPTTAMDRGPSLLCMGLGNSENPSYINWIKQATNIYRHPLCTVNLTVLIWALKSLPPGWKEERNNSSSHKY